MCGDEGRLGCGDADGKMMMLMVLGLCMVMRMEYVMVQMVS